MPAYGYAMIGRKLALTPMANCYRIALRSRARGGYDDRMTKTMIDFDAMLATLDAHDDDIDIDRFALIILAAHHLRESLSDADAARDFLLSYDLCPLHECDIEICADDADPECAEYRD